MTATYLVLGDPVAHSLSPLIQQAAFEFAGLDAVYERRRVDAQGLASVVDQIRSGEVAGANVTMPHKRLAAELADEVIGAGAQMGAANTLWHRHGRVMAASTDPDGVRFAWRHAGLPVDRPVLVLGAGGAAAAALIARQGGVRAVSARRRHAAEHLVEGLQEHAQEEQIRVVEWGTGLPGAVVVNATPIGMDGESLPEAITAEAGGLLEMAYGSGDTPAARLLRDRGLPVASGELMLVGQGLASFAIWTDREIPPEVMLEALPVSESGR